MRVEKEETNQDKRKCKRMRPLYGVFQFRVVGTARVRPSHRGVDSEALDRRKGWKKELGVSKGRIAIGAPRRRDLPQNPDQFWWRCKRMVPTETDSYASDLLTRAIANRTCES